MYKNSTKKANSCALHPNLRSSSPLPIREHIPIALRATKMVKQSQEKDHEDPMRIPSKNTLCASSAGKRLPHSLSIFILDLIGGEGGARKMSKPIRKQG